MDVIFGQTPAVALVDLQGQLVSPRRVSLLTRFAEPVTSQDHVEAVLAK